MRTRNHIAIPVLMALVLGVSACSGSDSDSSSDSSSDTGAGGTKDLLAKAHSSFDRASSVHFTLSSTNVPSGGTRLTGGEGVAARPQSFQGSLSVMINGAAVTVELVSVAGAVYAKLPFSTGFQKTDPGAFGLNDPATLVDPANGVGQIFDQLTDVTSRGEKRVAGDVTEQIDGNIPGSLVSSLLTSADPSQPVKASLYLTKDGNELRQAVLTGPFYEKGTDSEFTLVLTKYGDNPPITPPAGTAGTGSAAPTT